MDFIDSILTNAETGWGLALILWFQSWRTPAVQYVALIFHFIGSEVLFLPLTLFIYWSWDKHLGRRLIPFLMFASWVNASLKSTLRRPRPYSVSLAVDANTTLAVTDYLMPGVHETSYGIPSGHSQNAATVGGIIASERRQWWVLGLTVAYAIATGISRMILGVHYPQDVIVGISLGLIMLAIYGAVEPPLGKWLGSQSTWIKFSAVIAATTLIMIIHPILITPTSPVWLETVISPDDLLARPLLSIGIFLGSGIGFILEDRTLNFDWRGSWSQRIIRFLLGCIGIAALYFGLQPLSMGFQAIGGDLIRFGLVGFWIAYGAPWLFIRVGLASRTLKPDPYAEQ
jgi:membrane-associated phospholipid phosphatase